MNLVLWLIFLMSGLTAFIPLIHADIFEVDPKYHSFKYVSIIMFLWWFVFFIRLVSDSGAILYYLTLSIYPIAFLFIIRLYIAVKKYLGLKVSSILVKLMHVFLFFDFVLAMTNKYHNLYFTTTTVDNFTLEIAKNTDERAMFLLHTAISYVFLAVIVFYILRDVNKRLRQNHDVFPFIFMITSIIIGVGLNVIQVFFYTFYLDPTLLAIILIVTVLYYVFYIRDLKLLLGMNRNKFILNHLREMYVIVDENSQIVDASSEFIGLVGIQLKEESITYNELLKRIEGQVILFKDSEETFIKYEEGKRYLNTVQKPIYLPFYRHSGTFYLFFDQTTNLKYIYDMNYVKTHDLMTSIYNRNFLEEMRDDLDDNDIDFQVIMFDLDGLKLVNDYLGHNAGDEHLKRFANQLASLTQEEDVYAVRLGGDEFVILAVEKEDTYLESLLHYLDQINNDLPFMQKSFFSYATQKRNEENDSLKLVLAAVDVKMYQMKDSKSDYKAQLENELKILTK